jgi:hypothetical protein
MDPYLREARRGSDARTCRRSTCRSRTTQHENGRSIAGTGGCCGCRAATTRCASVEPRCAAPFRRRRPATPPRNDARHDRRGACFRETRRQEAGGRRRRSRLGSPRAAHNVSIGFRHDALGTLFCSFSLKEVDSPEASPSPDMKGLPSNSSGMSSTMTMTYLCRFQQSSRTLQMKALTASHLSGGWWWWFLLVIVAIVVVGLRGIGSRIAGSMQAAAADACRPPAFAGPVGPTATRWPKAAVVRRGGAPQEGMGPWGPESAQRGRSESENQSRK